MPKTSAPNSMIVVATHFPPIGGSASVRWVKMAKYLQQAGIQPTIITTTPDKLSSIDRSLESQIPENCDVIRRQNFEGWFLGQCISLAQRLLWKLRMKDLASRLQPLAAAWLAFPDYHLTWVPGTAREVLRVIRSKNSKVLLTSALPASCHLVGLIVKWRLGSQIHWIAEYRDEWTTYTKYPSRVHRAFNEILERNVLRRADLVIVVVPEMEASIGTLLPTVERPQFELVTNGFDPADFEMSKHRTGSLVETLKTAKVFSVAHIGMLFGSRTPGVVLAACRQLIDEGLIDSKTISINLVGPAHHPDSLQYAEESWLNLQDSVSYQDAVDIMRSQHLLLLLLHSDATRGLPSKLFEYVAARRPVLALAPETSSVADVMARLPQGVLIAPSDLIAAKEAILRSYLEWRNGDWTPASASEIEEYYSRDHQALRLAGMVRSLDAGNDQSVVEAS